MRLLALGSLIVTFLPAVAAEPLDDYIHSLEVELRARQGGFIQLRQQPSLDAKRLLANSNSILHNALPAQRQRLNEVLIALVPYHVALAANSPLENPLQHLAFMEVQVIYSEILDRGTQLQRASWAGNNQELLQASIQRLCSAPTQIDFSRRSLEAEINAGRYSGSSISQARALSARLSQRAAWYTSSANQSICQRISQARVAP
jgi:hypothetical protein